MQSPFHTEATNQLARSQDIGYERKDMKALTYIFYAAVAGIAVCLAMTIVTGIHEHQQKKAIESAPLSIPLPAEAPHS
jgi:hypothetical protein